MNQISIVGLDIAKKVFQVHGVDAAGVVKVRRSLRRSQVLAWFAKLAPCLIGWRPVQHRITGRAS
jgi:transposase